MVKTIKLNKNCLVEGKLLKKGSIIRVLENTEDYDAPTASSKASTPNDVEMLRRIRRIRKLRSMENSEDVPADEVTALRRNRKFRKADNETVVDAAALRRIKRLRKVDNGIDEEDEGVVAKALKKADGILGTSTAIQF